MKQKIFKTKFLQKLEEDIGTNQEYYTFMQSKPYWLKDMYERANNMNYDLTSKLEIEPFELICGGPETDKENAKIIYRNLIELTPAQAVVPELWTYMTHLVFPKYMAKRWEVDKKENKTGFIKERYFAVRGVKGTVRNGIARLWWAGKWAYDPNREDPYELVDIILDKQETFLHVSERSYNRNKHILVATLEAIKYYDLSSPQIKYIYKRINSYGSEQHLDALNYDEAKEMVNKIISEIKLLNI